MPTFAELPYEMRIEIFAQLNTSEDALSFRQLDRTNFQLITPKLYKKHGFLARNELSILEVFGRNQAMLRYTVDIFLTRYFAHFEGEKEDLPCKHFRRDLTVRSMLQSANGTESERRQALEVLKWLSHVKLDACNVEWEFRLGNSLNTAVKEYLEEILHKADSHTDGYQVVSEFYRIFYADLEPANGFESSSLFAFARANVLWSYEYSYGSLWVGRRYPRARGEPITNYCPPIIVANAALIPAGDCKKIFNDMKLEGDIVVLRRIACLFSFGSCFIAGACSRQFVEVGKPVEDAAATTMVSFFELPFEMRIEIFSQLKTSEDAISFRSTDRINYQLITPNLFSKHGFLTPKAINILANFSRSKLLRELTSNLFFRMYILSFSAHAEQLPCCHTRRDLTFRRILIRGMETERSLRSRGLWSYSYGSGTQKSTVAPTEIRPNSIRIPQERSTWRLC
ncbi:hypothetical protein BJ508DRAFT_381444 [Ascobolus immersus RN42]|uniref:F-box domain-containing protein n=1 Tax=Ascobolus immersus RN42 TaxID=1160509 RepID=A0A3N4HEP3_ASCIM|nr:hypothetical protein BJ508DRAFT_381444 [Ascobolus immersus RN42]